MEKPWTLQRCRFKTNIGKKNTHSLDETLSYDYMGSSEFEFGALNKSFKRILPELGKFRIIKTDYKDCTGRELFFIGPGEKFNEYSGFIPGILNGDRMQETTEFPTLYKPDSWNQKKALSGGGNQYYYTLHNINWDLDNDVFLIFSSKKYALAILEALENSKNKLNK